MPIFGFQTDIEWLRWAIAGGILAFFIVLALLSRAVLKGIMLLVAHHTKTKLDDMLVNSLGGPLFAGLIVAGLWLALIQIPELAPYLDIVRQAGVISFLTVITVVAVRVANVLLVWYGVEIAPRTKFDVDDKIIPLLQRVSKILIYAIGLLIILDQMNVNISPILAGLGIGGLAVALALQSTLTNFLAGTYVMSDAVIHTGDYIALDSGQEGFIEDIGWRTTKLRNWQGNLVILPNAKMSEAIITNYEKPDKAIIFAVECGVSYESDLSVVEKVALAVAEETLTKFPEGAKDFKPVLRFKRFGDSNIDFTVVLKSLDRVGQFTLKHEFIKILHKRFGEESIEIQYPVRKLYFAGGKGLPAQDDGENPNAGLGM